MMVRAKRWKRIDPGNANRKRHALRAARSAGDATVWIGPARASQPSATAARTSPCKSRKPADAAARQGISSLIAYQISFESDKSIAKTIASAAAGPRPSEPLRGARESPSAG